MIFCHDISRVLWVARLLILFPLSDFFCKSIAFTRENISTYHQGNTVDETSQTPLVENQV